MPSLSGEKRPLLTLVEQSSEPIKQGAEAKVYKATLYNDATPILLKWRFAKTYRHPALDAQLTKARITQEARCLVRAARAGVCVPGVRCVDLEAGILGLEWIEGQTVRDLLGGLPEDDEQEVETGATEVIQRLNRLSLSEGVRFLLLKTLDPLRVKDTLLALIGFEIAKLHASDTVHGDLTTSNMMISSATAKIGMLVLIDFGLAHVSTLIEDKAVDLYVLERALVSTHPEPEPQDAPDGYQTRFSRILRAYAEHLGAKEWKRIGSRLAEVQLRGRKRSMVG